MPEVCEVALTTEILHKKIKGGKIVDVKIYGKYKKNIKYPDGFKEFVNGLPWRIKKVSSTGKFIWFVLEHTDGNGDRIYIWNTLGLTGMWSFYEPDYPRFVFELVNGIKFWYSDKLSYGTIKFSSDKKALLKKIAGLLPDFLKTEDFDIFDIKKYGDKKIVEILMDQKKIGSGLGNYLTAEILYRAKISPHRKCNKLSDEDILNLTYWIKYMVKLCYTNNDIGYMVNLEKESKKIPRKNYHPEIKLKEKEFEFQVYEQPTDPHGNPVKKDKIIKGRTTYWVPNVQI
jgi:formamidopyrimidine-DNA glycosylase